MSQPLCTRPLRRACRLALASLCAAASVACLWFALDLHPFRRTAAAESVGPDATTPAITSSETARAAADSLAGALGGALAALPEEMHRTAVAAALDRLSLHPWSLEHGIFYSAWEDTRLVHFPLAPDLTGHDFGSLTDARGVAAADALALLAASGGGSVLLHGLRQQAAADPEAAQEVHVRPLPDSDWYIAVFIPEEVLAPSASGEHARSRALRGGLCLSGASFAGLAGLLALPRRRQTLSARP